MRRALHSENQTKFIYKMFLEKNYWQEEKISIIEQHAYQIPLTHFSLQKTSLSSQEFMMMAK